MGLLLIYKNQFLTVNLFHILNHNCKTREHVVIVVVTNTTKFLDELQRFLPPSITSNI